MREQSITVQINAKSCNAGITLQSNKEVQMPIHCVVARPRAIIDIHTYIYTRIMAVNCPLLGNVKEDTN